MRVSEASDGTTLDKTMGESYAPGVRQHLMGIEVERPIAAIEGSRKEKRGLLVRGDRRLLLPEERRAKAYFLALVSGRGAGV
jgi:hypothetical protein